MQVLLPNMPGMHIKTFTLTKDFIFMKRRRGALEVSSCMEPGTSHQGLFAALHKLPCRACEFDDKPRELPGILPHLKLGFESGWCWTNSPHCQLDEGFSVHVHGGNLVDVSTCSLLTEGACIAIEPTAMSLNR